MFYLNESVLWHKKVKYDNGKNTIWLELETEEPEIIFIYLFLHFLSTSLNCRIYISGSITSLLGHQFVLHLQLNFLKTLLFLNLLLFETAYFISENDKVHVHANSKKNRRSILKGKILENVTSVMRPVWRAKLRLPYTTVKRALTSFIPLPGCIQSISAIKLACKAG